MFLPKQTVSFNMDPIMEVVSRHTSSKGERIIVLVFCSVMGVQIKMCCERKGLLEPTRRLKRCFSKNARTKHAAHSSLIFSRHDLHLTLFFQVTLGPINWGLYSDKICDS